MRFSVNIFLLFVMSRNARNHELSKAAWHFIIHSLVWFYNHFETQISIFYIFFNLFIWYTIRSKMRMSGVWTLCANANFPASLSPFMPRYEMFAIIQLENLFIKANFMTSEIAWFFILGRLQIEMIYSLMSTGSEPLTLDPKTHL